MKTEVIIAFIIIPVVLIAAFFGYSVLTTVILPPVYEEKLTNWVNTHPIILAGQEEVPVSAAEPVEEYTHVIIRDAQGNIIAIVSMEELLGLIKQNQVVTVPYRYGTGPSGGSETPVEVTPENPPSTWILPIQPPSSSIPGAPPLSPTPVIIPVPIPQPSSNLTNLTAPVPPTPTPAPTPPSVTPSPLPYPPMCSDGQWNADESDQDCGGSCAPCSRYPAYFSACWVNSDCVSNFCDMTFATPLPAIDPLTQVAYNNYATLRNLAGQMWIIPYSGLCR